MAPTSSSLIAAWRELRRSEKVGLYGYRSQSEIVLPRQSVPLGRLDGPPRRQVQALTAAMARLDVVLELSASDAGDEDEASDSVDTIAMTNQREHDAAFAQEATRFDDDEDGDEDRETTEDGVADLKIFVATWNMAAKDPFTTSKGEYVGDDDAANKLSGLLPPGYDLYVLGTQEKVSKHLHQAVLARLHAAERTTGRRFVCLQRPESTRKRTRRWSRKQRTSGDNDSDNNNNDNNDNASTRSTRAPSDGSNDSSSHHNSLSGYLQSFALEASSSIPVLSSTSADNTSIQPSARSSAKPRHSLFSSRSAAKEAPFATEVSGRGDGAFLSSKSTSLSLYCACDLVDVVEIVRSGTHKFSFASGSKGGVAVMLRVAGHSLTFMNCHLDANRPSVRRGQLSDLCSQLAAALGLGASRPITTCSDHVIWMGDFNYRIHTLDGASVLKQIAMGRHLEVHDRYDSMRDDLAMLPDLHLFQEPSKWPTFFPTYKKIPGRPPHVEPNGTTDPAWPTRVYRVAFREPFYKGGKLRARVPGWCDRILYSSMAGRDSALSVEQVECPLDQYLRRSMLDDIDPSQLRDNYRAVNDGLCESDHSPVVCAFRWSVPVHRQHASRRVPR